MHFGASILALFSLKPARSFDEIEGEYYAWLEKIVLYVLVHFSVVQDALAEVEVSLEKPVSSQCSLLLLES